MSGVPLAPRAAFYYRGLHIGQGPKLSEQRLHCATCLPFEAVKLANPHDRGEGAGLRGFAGKPERLNENAQRQLANHSAVELQAD